MELEVPSRPPKLKDSPIELVLPPPRKLELCRRVKYEMKNKIKEIIDNISSILIEREVELTLDDIIELTLQLPVYMKLYNDKSRDMEICIKYIDGTSSCYVHFPLVDESILIRGVYRESSEEIMV